MIGLFCKRALQNRRCSAKETYNFMEPTNRSHPIVDLYGHFYTCLRCIHSMREYHLVRTGILVTFYMGKNEFMFVINMCNTLPNTATRCGTLQHTATHCGTLQHAATHCNPLQHTATRCSTLQHTATAAHCSTLYSYSL